MSLHKFAEQVAAHGRGDDSLLVHMTPDEVQRLQKFAEANGRTLTINPHTGLPEAGFLSDLFKAVAPIALGAFLGPAGMGITFGGLSSAASAGLLTGGITSLATGSLSRGLMAGLGAYGGAGLGESLMTAGGGMSAANAASAAQGQLGAANLALGEAMPAQAAEQFTKDAVARMTPTGAVSAGIDKAIADPLAFAKNNVSNLAYAAAPIAAGAMVPTTTKLDTPKSDNYIRQYDFNINPETGKPDPLYGVRAMTPVKASEWGNKTFEGQRELFRQQNPNPYELGVGSLNQPPQPVKPMADGGIVALAGGGVSDQQVFDWFKANQGADDKTIAAAMQQYDVSPEQIARATGTQNQLGDYQTRFVKAIETPTTSAPEFLAATQDVGLQNQALANALQNSGMSQAAQYASTHQLNDTAPITGTNFYNQIGYKPGALPGDQGGLEGLYANINYAAQGLQNQIASGNMTGQQAREAALTEMNRIGMSAADLQAATGKSLAELFPDTKVKPPVVTPPPFTSVVPGETKLNTATTYDNGAFGNYGSGNKTGTDYLGRTVSIATPGDIITNPDQTRTVVPNIPGRPYGGFTGIDAIKSAYTAGGGSLGYTAKAPRTIAEFNQLYNKQTGDSLAAYDYLMGKGANNNAFPVKSGVPKISQNYGEYVLGKKVNSLKPVTTTPTTTTKVLNEDGTLNQEATDKANFDYKSYLKANPDVQAELDKGTANFGSKDDLASAAYNHYITYGKAQNRPLKVAAEGGMMGYAMGGGLGSLGSYSDGGRLLKGPGDGVSDSIPATIGAKGQPARLADGEFVVPARIVSELGNGSTEAGAKKLYAMMDRVQKARGKTTGKNKVAANSRADKYLPA